MSGEHGTLLQRKHIVTPAPVLHHTPSEPSCPSALEYIATHELPEAGPTQTLGRIIPVEFAPHLQLLRATYLAGVWLVPSCALLQIRSDPLPSLPSKETKVRTIERSIQRGVSHVPPLSVDKRREFPFIIAKDIHRDPAV